MIFRILFKDIKMIFSDKKALFGFIAMPMILTTILSVALASSFGEPGRQQALPIAIVSAYDAEAEKQELLEKMPYLKEGIDALDLETIFFETFLENETLKAVLDVSMMTLSEAETAMNQSEVIAYMVLDEGFLYKQYVNLLTADREELVLKVIRHPDYNYSGQIITSIFQGYFDRLNSKAIEKNTYFEVAALYLDTDRLYENLSLVMADSETIEASTTITIQEVTGRRHISSFTYYTIAMTAMFILYTSSFLGRELLIEKRMRTLDRSTVSGHGYMTVIVAKALMAIMLCAVQMLVLIAYSKVFLSVQWDSPLKLIVSILFSAFAVSGLGVFISAITLTSDNFRVANIFENVVIHIFALFGGSYIPIDNLPGVFALIKNFTLNGIVIDLFIGIYRGLAWSEMSIYLIRLTIVGLVFGIVGMIMIKRKEVMAYVGSLKA